MEPHDPQAAALRKYWARQPKSTRQMVDMMQQHYQEMQTSLDAIRNDRFLGVVAERSAQMRDALVQAGITPETSVIGGEQSGIVFPANIEKSIVGAALHYMTEGAINYIGLRADWDIVRSQTDMFRADMPRASAKEGVVPVGLLTKNTFDYGEVSAGIPVPNEDLSAKLVEFRENVKQSYPGEFLGTVLKEFDIFVNCMGYGFDENGGIIQLKNLPWMLENQIEGSTQRNIPTTFEQLTRTKPASFASGLENYFMYLVEKMDIQAQVPVSEGVIDKFLLVNGGYELLRATWDTTMQKLADATQRSVDPYVPVTFGKKLYEQNSTFFNISTGPRQVCVGDNGEISVDGCTDWKIEAIETEKLAKKGFISLVGPDGDRIAVETSQITAGANFNVAGIRYETAFDPNDPDYIIAFNPKTKGEPFRIHVADALDMGSKWQVSLTAVARVVMYNLAGIGGHVVGSAAYNADADEFAKAIKVPYFPTYATKLSPDGTKKRESMLQYESLSIQKDQARLEWVDREIAKIMGSDQPDMALLKKRQEEKARLENSIATVGALTAKGSLSITDLQFSVALEGVKAVIAEHMRMTGGDINATHQMRFANRAGRMPK